MNEIKRHHQRLQIAMNKFNSLRQKGSLCDVTFKVDNQTFPAHKAFLASQSPYFEAMFTGKQKEATDNVVELKDISATTFDVVLKYLYGSQVEFRDHIYSIMMAADRFCIDLLLEDCKELVMDQWLELDAMEVHMLTSQFDLKPEMMKNQVETVKERIRGDSEVDELYETLDLDDCSHYMKAHHSYISMALKENLFLDQPIRAVDFLENWLAYDKSRVIHLPNLFPLYPWLRIPSYYMKSIIDNSSDSSSLKNIYRECCSSSQTLDVKIIGCIKVGSRISLQNFNLHTFSWEDLGVTTPFSANVQMSLSGSTLCVLSEDEVHIIDTSLPIENRKHTIPFKSGKLIHYQENYVFILEVAQGKSKIVKINLPSLHICMKSTTQITTIYESSMCAENEIHIIGSEVVECTQMTSNSGKGALYIYNPESGDTGFLADLPVKVSNPVLCKYKDYLLTVDNDVSDMLVICIWNNITHEMTCQKVMFSSNDFSSNSMLLLAAGISKTKENKLVLLIRLQEYLNLVVVATSVITTIQECNSLHFSCLEAEAFLPQPEYHNQFISCIGIC